MQERAKAANDDERTAVKTPPFRIQEEGWGEFDMQIRLVASDKEHPITHDLNFAQNRYESKHVIVRLPLPASDLLVG